MEINKELEKETIIFINRILIDSSKDSYEQYRNYLENILDGNNEIVNCRTIALTTLNIRHFYEQEKLFNSQATKYEKMEYKFKIEFIDILHELSMQYFNTL